MPLLKGVSGNPWKLLTTHFHSLSLWTASAGATTYFTVTQCSYILAQHLFKSNVYSFGILARFSKLASSQCTCVLPPTQLQSYNSDMNKCTVMSSVCQELWVYFTSVKCLQHQSNTVLQTDICCYKLRKELSIIQIVLKTF